MNGTVSGDIGGVVPLGAAPFSFPVPSPGKGKNVGLDKLWGPGQSRWLDHHAHGPCRKQTADNVTLNIRLGGNPHFVAGGEGVRKSSSTFLPQIVGPPALSKLAQKPI